MVSDKSICEHKEWEVLSENMLQNERTGETIIVNVYKCVDCGKTVEERGTLK